MRLVKPSAFLGLRPRRLRMAAIWPSGVLIEEAVDLGDQLRIGLGQLPGLERNGEDQGPGGATLEADVDVDLLPLEQGHVLEKEADHALSLPWRGLRVVPEAREVGGQGQDLLPPLLVN